MSVRKKVQKINGFHRLIEHILVTLGGGYGEPARTPSDPNPDLTIIMLAISVVGNIFDNNALVKVVLVQN